MLNSGPASGRKALRTLPLIHAYVARSFSCFIRRMESLSRGHSKAQTLDL